MPKKTMKYFLKKNNDDMLKARKEYDAYLKTLLKKKFGKDKKKHEKLEKFKENCE